MSTTSAKEAQTVSLERSFSGSVCKDELELPTRDRGKQLAEIGMFTGVHDKPLGVMDKKEASCGFPSQLSAIERLSCPQRL
jgi:hypothetical protein